MCGTSAEDPLSKWTLESACFLLNSFVQRPDGSLEFSGERPGADWHGHGYFGRWLWVRKSGSTVRIRLHKRRWLHREQRRSCHSRPPMEVGRLSVCALVLALELWAWLTSDRGVHTAPSPLPAQDPRTRQRHLHRLLPRALEIQQAIRRALIERSEPRPLERIFPGGLPPPATLKRKWSAPATVETLWRALALLLEGSAGLVVPAALLLVEARRRDVTPKDPRFP